MMIGSVLFNRNGGAEAIKLPYSSISMLAAPSNSKAGILKKNNLKVKFIFIPAAQS